MRTILRRLLIESGYTDVTEVHDVTSARVAAIDARPDIVVVDWQLPDGNAADLVRVLRAEGDGGSILVLAPAHLDGAADVIRAVGADDCVSKPFTGQDMRRCLARFAERDAA
jgi:DNA-binding response OmpR family regulator